MKKLMIATVALAALCGCSVTKIDYEKDKNGVVSYRIYHNDHWLKRDTGAMSGGMGQDGKFELSLEKTQTSPSEEFSKSMQVFTRMFTEIARLAAAAYNPSSTGVAAANAAAPAQTVVNVQPAASVTTNAVEATEAK